jgi:hypothetical protein
MIEGISTLLGRGRAAGLSTTRTRTAPVFQQSNTPALHHSVPSLSVETKTLLHIFFGAVCAWLVLRTVPKLYKGPLEAIDNYLLRALRRPDNPAIPIGPKWLPQAAKDVTALGSGTNLTIVTGILVGFLCLNRRFRATGFLLSSLGSGLLLCQSLKGFFCAAPSNNGSASCRFRSGQLSQWSFYGSGTGLFNVGQYYFPAGVWVESQDLFLVGGVSTRRHCRY